MTKLTKEIFDGLKQEHSEAFPLRKGDVEVVLRPMTKQEFERFLDQSAKSRSRDEVPTVHMNNAVRDCLLFPSVDEFNAALNKTPGIGMAFCNKLLEKAGADSEAEEIAFL